MKKLFILCLLVLTASLSAQQINQTFVNDTCTANQTKYTTTGAVVKYNGVVTFDVTAVNDTCTIYLEGSNDSGTTWSIVTTQASNVVAATHYVFTQSPPQFITYRLRKVTNAYSIVRFSKQRFIYKR